MCSISGIVNGDIDQIIQAQKHRGPDGNSFVKQHPNNNQVSFGHTRLSIIDLTDHGSQPMQSDRYILTANCEIYNYKEMKSVLSADDPTIHGINTFHTDNDAKTLLRYINQHGIEKALNEANGMFAIGLFDKRERKIHLAVDRFAQKPIYYTMQGDTFAFASSPAALLHLRDKWNINWVALHSYWKLGSVMYDSIFDGIYKVNAAEHITYEVDTKKLSKRRYWEPKYQENTNGIEDLVLDSIRKVKVSDVPIFIFLSGGIDSTLVASQFEGGNAIHLKSPEQVYAQEAADRFKIKLHVVNPAEVDPIKGMRDYVQKSGEPSMAGLIPWITSMEAVKFSKVAISANGADELFFGYNRTHQNITNDQRDHIFRKSVLGTLELKYDIDERLSHGRWLELMTYVQSDLNKTLDFSSMSHSLEVRCPFLDHRLVEMALSIPEEKCGRKQILKNMLHKMGFSHTYTDRPKMGFSLYTPIPGLDQLQSLAYEWAINENFLKLNSAPNARDLMYLKASAFGFNRWYNEYKNILS